MPTARDALGDAIGHVWAPAVARISRARRARMFHPAGHTYGGTATLVDGPFAELGETLSGRVLARLSAALWRNWEHLDVLGLALRVRGGDGPPLDEYPAPGDQDLLTATIRSPFTMLGSPLATDASDYAGNSYWAVSPFQHALAGRIVLRLIPVAPPGPTRGTRAERLAAAVRAGDAAWFLQARRTLTWRWYPVMRVNLTHPVELDQEALAFDPFRGALRPVGVVQSIRHAVYAASQRARPRHELSHSSSSERAGATLRGDL